MYAGIDLVLVSDTHQARRRVEDLRLEMEGRRREWERQRLQADRAKKDRSDMVRLYIGDGELVEVKHISSFRVF